MRELESQNISQWRKFQLIRTLLRPEHEYLSFIVCRNPVEKLLSVYNFMLYQTQENPKKKGNEDIFRKFPKASMTRPI